MKRSITLLSLMFTALCLAAQNLSIAGYNIRNDNTKDVKNGNAWKDRAPRIVSLVNYEAWDVLAMQEVTHSQLQDLQQSLTDYNYIGVGRNDGATKGEYTPIFYKTSRIKCLQHGTFWLSETPDSVGTKGWDAALPRICTWVFLKDKASGRKFWVFNLHLDHVGQKSRVESARLVLQRIAEMCNNAPFVLTGDFNVNQHSDVYAELIASGKFFDTYETARHRMAENGSFNGFRATRHSDEHIDHIFVSKHFQVHRYGILTPFYWVKNASTQEVQLRHYSDHFPISTVLELPK
jgi:endonuclease/exonuclease/phosphatase family metal-dependent hydrolase